MSRVATRPPWVPLLLIFGQLVGSMVDFGTLGLTSNSGLDLGKWLVLLPGLMFGLYLTITSPQLMRWMSRGPALVLSMWFGWALLGVIWSVSPQDTVLQLVSALTLVVTGFWFMKSAGREEYARVFCLASFVVLAGGLLVDLIAPIGDLLPETGIKQTAFAEETGRRPGLTPGVNQLAMLAGFTMMMLVRISPRNRVEQIMRVTSFLVALAAMGFSGSRSVAVCTLLALAVQFSLDKPPGVRVQAAGLLASVGLIAVAAIGVTGAETTFQAGRSLESLNGREAVWDYGLELATRRPMTGLGMMAGDVLWTEAFFRARTSFDPGDSHNMALEIMIGSGTIGLALFATAVLWAVGRSVAQRDSDAMAILALLLFVGLTEALVGAASVTWSVLGAVFAMVAIDRVAFPRPDGRSGNPEAMFGDRSDADPPVAVPA